MKFKILAVLIGISCLFLGCSTINFSAHYFTPPENYREEIQALFKEINRQLPLTYKYTLKIVQENKTDGSDGIPGIKGLEVRLPVNFNKYVYQNYFDDRNKIMTSIVVHELMHQEFDLSSANLYEHVKTDIKAIEMLKKYSEVSVEDFYSALKVMHNYWFARKGVAGHALNTAWNAANLAAVYYVGHGTFGDLYGTDIRSRLKSLRRKYNFKNVMTYARFDAPEHPKFIGEFVFKDVFKKDSQIQTMREEFQVVMSQLIQEEPSKYQLLEVDFKNDIYTAPRYSYKTGCETEHVFMTKEKLEHFQTMKYFIKAPRKQGREQVQEISFLSQLLKDYKKLDFIKSSCEEPYHFEQDCSGRRFATKKMGINGHDKIKIAGTKDGRVILLMGKHRLFAVDPLIKILNSKNIKVIKSSKFGKSEKKINGLVFELDGDGYTVLQKYLIK